MRDGLTRRDFLKRAAATGAAAAGFGGLLDGLSAEGAAGPTIAVASKHDPAGLVRTSVQALGGMGKFVK